MNSDSWLPLVTLHADVPVISQSIGNQVADWRNFCATYRGGAISQLFYFVSDIEIPKVHQTIASACHEPYRANWGK